MQISCPQNKSRSLSSNNVTYLGLLCLLRGLAQKGEVLMWVLVHLGAISEQEIMETWLGYSRWLRKQIQITKSRFTNLSKFITQVSISSLKATKNNNSTTKSSNFIDYAFNFFRSTSFIRPNLHAIATPKLSSLGENLAHHQV